MLKIEFKQEERQSKMTTNPKEINNMLNKIFRFKHMLTPIAIEHWMETQANGKWETFKILRVFGLRFAQWSTMKFDDK